MKIQCIDGQISVPESKLRHSNYYRTLLCNGFLEMTTKTVQMNLTKKEAIIYCTLLGRKNLRLGIDFLERMDISIVHLQEVAKQNLDLYIWDVCSLYGILHNSECDSDWIEDVIISERLPTIHDLNWAFSTLESMNDLQRPMEYECEYEPYWKFIQTFMERNEWDVSKLEEIGIGYILKFINNLYPGMIYQLQGRFSIQGLQTIEHWSTSFCEMTDLMTQISFVSDIERMSHLTSLDLSIFGNTSALVIDYTNKIMNKIRDQIESLSLSKFQSLTTFRHLKTLRLTNVNFEDSMVIEQLSTYPLTTLILETFTGSPSQLQSDTIQTLYILSPFSGDGLFLTRFPNLDSLMIMYDEQLTLPKLNVSKLSIHCLGFPRFDNDFSWLTMYPKLTHLTLNRCKGLTDNLLKNLMIVSLILMECETVSEQCLRSLGLKYLYTEIKLLTDKYNVKERKTNPFAIGKCVYEYTI